jgi:hypothetical protein
MDSGLWELGKVVFTAVLAALLTHLLSHRRFIQGQWWERKKEAYDDIISSLVGLIRSLEWKREDEERFMTERGYEPSQEVQKAVYREYKKARDQIERAVIEGDYVVTRKAANALGRLVEALEDKRRVWYSPAWCQWLDNRRGTAESCLEILRAEARSDLRVGWWSL